MAAGNEAVLRARFQDAQFFYQEDLKGSLEQFRPALGGMMFHAELGKLNLGNLPKRDTTHTPQLTRLAPAHRLPLRQPCT